MADRLQAAAGAMTASIPAISLLGWPLSKVKAHWGQVLIRVAGAWIAAICIMIFALNYRVAFAGFG